MITQSISRQYERARAARIHRYLLVGGTAAIAEYGSFLVLYKSLGLQLYVVNTISFCCGLGVSFTLNREWTFKAGSFRMRGHHQFALYAALALVNVFLTNVLLALLKRVGISPLIGKLVAMAIIAVWNFAIFKNLIFVDMTVERSLVREGKGKNFKDKALVRKAYKILKNLRHEYLNAQNCFLLIAIPIGLILVFSVPLLGGADEAYHTARAYQISKGHFVSISTGADTRKAGGYGGQIPASLAGLIHYSNIDKASNTRISSYGTGQINDPSRYKKYGSLKLNSQPEVLYAFPGAAAYSPISYIPTAIAAGVARLFNFNLASTIYLMRLSDLVFYITCIYLSLYILRATRYKWIIFSVSLIPTMLGQASTITADAVTLSVAVLLVALVAKGWLASERFARWEVALLLVAAALIPVVKPSYALLSLLILLIPHDVWGIKKSRVYALKGTAIAAGLALFASWNYLIRDVANAVRLILPGSSYQFINPGLQEQYVIHHLLATAKTFVRTLFLNDNTYLVQAFGGSSLPGVGLASSFMAIILGFLLSDTPSRPVSRKAIALVTCTVLGSIGAILGTLYLTISPVGSPIVGGVQGRYFLPLLIPMLLCIAAVLPWLRFTKKELSIKQYSNICMVLCVCVAVALVAYTTKLLYVMYG